MIQGDLKRRLTNKYVGTYQHEDEWEYIGRYTILSSERWRLECNEDPDPTDPMKHFYTIKVEDVLEGYTIKDVEEAIKDSFSKIGCHHEHDCCGCRSYYAKNPIHQITDYYKLEVNSWRNY